MKKLTEKSIRIELLGWLLIPLSSLCLISTSLAYFLAVNFANGAYDNQLLNTADSVGARLASDGESVWLDLPPAAQAILRGVASPDIQRAARYKGHDNTFYQVLKEDGSRVAGDALLPLPLGSLQAVQPMFRTARMEGMDVRIVRIRVNISDYPHGSLIVQVAETLDNRLELAQQILASIVVPQIILIVLGSVTVSLGITRGLSSLKVLAGDLSKRSQFDLTPVTETDAPTEVRPLVAAINDLLARLAEDIQSQRRFVANAAHQLRTPLAGLKTYIYAAKRMSHDERMVEMLDQIDNGSDRITHLANKLLSLAKAEPAGQTADHTKLDINLIVCEVVEDMLGEAQSKEIELSLETSEAPAVVLGESNSLYELCANLIENAIIYTPSGGMVCVSIENGDKVSLIVSDNGPGIPPEDRDRVFERFYRVLGTEQSGSGLGLSIVKEIATAHNADIQLCDGPEQKGTIVKVNFALPEKVSGE